ncbi:MAG TPA: hypothetical protein VF179_23475 [Thermoanaerobaculia bacterium]|nr:hypothetical protein [Thermoanaerobaculia bacterium]
MTLNLSIAQMLANLETKVELHRERKHFHAEQEAIHREQTSLHAAELDTALARLEAFRSAAEAAGELLDQAKLAALPPPQPDLDDADLIRKRSLSRMVARVVAGLPADQTFGARAVTREIQERWGAKLRRRPDPRSVAATLRRWALAGRLHQVREGRAYYESLYAKQPPRAVAILEMSNDTEYMLKLEATRCEPPSRALPTAET